MKFLIIRFSSIGDIILTTPIIRCIRKTYPESKIHFLTKPKFSQLLSKNPYLDEVKVLQDKRHSTVSELKEENYDHIIDLHKNLRTRSLRMSLKKPYSTFNKLNLRKWIFTNFKINLLPKTHLVDRYFNGIQSLDVKNDHEGLDHFIDDIDIQLLKNNGLSKKGYFVFAIGGTYATKKLPNHKIAEIINGLIYPCVTIGGPEDKDNEDQIKALVNTTQLIQLSGKLSLEESAQLIANSKTTISHDTGMMHIAAALKVPVVSIWGNTHPDFGMFPYFPNKINLKDFSFIHQVSVSCRPCSKLGYNKCPKKHFNCMQLQNTEEIVNNCNSIDFIQ